MNLVRLASIALVLATLVAPTLTRAQTPAVPSCTPADLALAVGASGDDGMLHDAVYLALINTGATACSVPGHPHVTLADASGRAIVADASTAVPRFMHPGPVIVPIAIAPRAALVTEIRWASGNGNARSNACSNIATVALEGAHAPLEAMICASDTPDAKPHLDVLRYGAPGA